MKMNLLAVNPVFPENANVDMRVLLSLNQDEKSVIILNYNI